MTSYYVIYYILLHYKSFPIFIEMSKQTKTLTKTQCRCSFHVFAILHFSSYHFRDFICYPASKSRAVGEEGKVFECRACWSAEIQPIQQILSGTAYFCNLTASCISFSRLQNTKKENSVGDFSNNSYTLTSTDEDTELVHPVCR